MSSDMKQKKKAEPFVWQYPVVMRRGFWRNEWEAVAPATWLDGSPARHFSPLKFKSESAANEHAVKYLAGLSDVKRSFVLWHGAKFYPGGEA